MTKFQKENELKELCKDYQSNKIQIFEIVYEYFKENEEELAQKWANEVTKNFVTIQQFKP